MPELDFIQHIEAGAPEFTDLKAVAGVAYSGGAIRQAWSRVPIVVDLSGLQLAAQIPLLFNHENRPESRLGAVEVEVSPTALTFRGGVDTATDKGRMIAQTGRKYHWQVSIGALPLKAEKVKEGEIRAVNGREFTGPILCVTAAKLTEISVVAVGADTDTMMQIAAAMVLSTPEKGEKEMEKEMTPVTPETPAPEVHAAQPAPVLDAEIVKSMAAQAVEDIRAQELKRVEALREITRDYPDVQARAFRENWDVTKAQAFVEGMKQVTASLPTATPNVIVKKEEGLNQKALEAALCLSAGMQLDEKDYKAEVLEAAEQYRGIGLQGVFDICAKAEGKEVHTYSFGNERIVAGLSTLSLPNVLSNVQQKAVWKAYNSVPWVSKTFCSTGTVKDFKEVQRIRITDIDDPEQLMPGGEIKHSTFKDERMTNRIYEYALMMAIDRTMIINDDMNMLAQVPSMLGRKMGEFEEKFFWKLLLSNPGGLFSAAHKNYISGASSAFSADSLTTLRSMFNKQTNTKGDPIAVAPKYLLAPYELEPEVRRLLESEFVISVGGGSQKATAPNLNICSKFGLQAIFSHYLSHDAIPGASATGWYLASDPNDCPVFEQLFLNGQQSPVVERAEMDFNRLGIQYRVYHDFNIKAIDHRGFAFATGA